MSFQHLSVDELKHLKNESDEVTVLDIRDPVSFESGHIDGALHLTNDNVQERLAEVPTDRPVVVCCYHGNSSQPVAQWLSEQGFETVYSLDGGYSAWALIHP
ncbi:thiosulfate sulfurtransferase GlpE [Saccharospirillum salsuginis]|uniref:Thiosulfate sulfurtransferase GlpE n=1 Tax=Saccharospirillum salsuginis TaxID=418750 RepID=A0A918K4C0_9GAMM|nr:thiosulfate sulfurtransferase GlpE [Saccharospirillum salsuginis]GGX49251.1 thiosulfate sulfurtransferase GlpE [Saccharospirillum salsuginis]